LHPLPSPHLGKNVPKFFISAVANVNLENMYQHYPTSNTEHISNMLNCSERIS